MRKETMNFIENEDRYGGVQLEGEKERENDIIIL